MRKKYKAAAMCKRCFELPGLLPSGACDTCEHNRAIEKEEKDKRTQKEGEECEEKLRS